MPIIPDDVAAENQPKGDLFVQFDIKFPKTLNESQRRRIETILGAGDEN